ncbi:hypothetical protein ACFQXB_05490 [Plastorhodobacter daqingensis]|uniref:Uncharacterized protein n=1 Tax=Plastorhodobacter daqingensis TaxID=1387281 RepID=A0ABW2UJ76_9RHOB
MPIPMFRLVPLALLAAFPAAAQTEDFCGLPPENWPATVTPLVAGSWQSEALSGLAVVEGEALAMPERVRGLASFRADAGRLFLTPPDTPAEFELRPAEGEDWDLAMPGEASLPAAEVFADPAYGLGLPCPLADLPRYRTEGRLEDAEGGVEFSLFLVVADPGTIYGVTTADLSAPDGTAGVARVVSRFLR